MSAPPPLPPAYRRWEAAVLNGPDALKLSEAPLSPPKPGEVLLRVLATDATYTDLLVLTDAYYSSRSGAPSNPAVPGCACSALVAAVGADAAHAFAVGDVVLALRYGSAAEYLALPARLCVKVEDAALAAFVRERPEVAAALPLTGVTAFQMLHRVAGATRLRAPNACVLVTGAAGGTGSMLVQLAKLVGVVPARIVGTCSRKNLEAVAALGATPVCYEDADWPAQARAATGGAGFVAAFDGVALRHYGDCVSLLAAGGVYTAYGLTLKHAAAGTLPMAEVVPLFTQLGVRHNLLHGLFGAADASFYSVNDRAKEFPEEFREDLLALLKLAAGGRLEVVIGRVHEFFELKSVRGGEGARAGGCERARALEHERERERERTRARRAEHAPRTPFAGAQGHRRGHAPRQADGPRLERVSAV